MLDELVNLMVEVIEQKQEYVNHGKCKRPWFKVKDVFLRIRYEHIEYVLLCLEASSTPITNPLPYMITTLYNSFFTKDTHITSKVNSLTKTR